MQATVRRCQFEWAEWSIQSQCQPDTRFIPVAFENIEIPIVKGIAGVCTSYKKRLICELILERDLKGLEVWSKLLLRFQTNE